MGLSDLAGSVGALEKGFVDDKEHEHRGKGILRALKRRRRKEARYASNAEAREADVRRVIVIGALVATGWIVIRRLLR